MGGGTGIAITKTIQSMTTVQKLRQSMASGNYNPRITRLLEMIAEYPNIPRKKSKFEVFS